MSTYWGYVCLSHDPPMISERWLNRGGMALADLYRKERAGEWPNTPEDHPFYLAFEGSPLPMLAEGDTAIPVDHRLGGGAPPWSDPPEWLREHPNCKVGVRSEYGVVLELGPLPHVGACTCGQCQQAGVRGAP